MLIIFLVLALSLALKSEKLQIDIQQKDYVVGLYLSVDMTNYWDLIRTRTVRSDREVDLPDPVGKRVISSNVQDKLRKEYEWNYEKHNRVAIFSNKPLEDDRYLHVTKNKGKGESFIVQSQGYIRIPKEVHNNLTRPIYEGLEMVYLAHEEMLEGETRSCYLLTESQALRLMNSDDEDGEDLQTLLSNTPAFLSPPTSI